MLDAEPTHMDKHDPDDPVARYILEASKVEPLTKVEEAKLFEKWAIGAIGTNRGKMLRGDWLKVSSC